MKIKSKKEQPVPVPGVVIPTSSFALSLSSSLARKNNVDRPSSCLIEVWDIEKAVLVETYVTRTGSASDPVSELLSGGTIGQEVETTAAVAISALVRSSQDSGTSDDFGDTTAPPLDVPHPHCDIRAMVVGSDFGVYIAHQRPEFGELDMIPGSLSRSSGRGFIVTGSEDAKIRLWDLAMWLPLSKPGPWFHQAVLQRGHLSGYR